MTVQDLENLKPGDIPHIDLEAMPVLVDVAFRIPVNLGEDHNHRGMYKAMAVPVNLPNGHKGYHLSVMKRDEVDRKQLSLIWSETIGLKDDGFILSNYEANTPVDTECEVAVPSNYLRVSPSPFVLRLKVSVLHETPEKLQIKLLGLFSGDQK